jgi:hypothetical protein
MTTSSLDYVGVLSCHVRLCDARASLLGALRVWNKTEADERHCPLIRYLNPFRYTRNQFSFANFIVHFRRSLVSKTKNGLQLGPLRVCRDNCSDPR